MLKEVEVCLIGGGPACASAAIGLKRSGKEILLISENIGGLIKNANLIENLLGFPKGIRGEELVHLIKNQLDQNHVAILNEKVRKVEKNDDSFLITTQTREIKAKKIIIGTGTNPNKLNIEGEEEAFASKKLFYDVYDLLPFAQDKHIAIVGSGDAAYDYALNLCRKAKVVTIVQKGEKSKGLSLLLERAKSKANINVVTGVDLQKIKIVDFCHSRECGNPELMVFLDPCFRRDDKLGKGISSDYILVAIGRKPNIDFLSDELQKEFYNPKHESQIYFIGDVKNANFRQVAIAMGDGVRVAMEIV